MAQLRKTGIKKTNKKSQTNKEKRHLDTQVLQCMPRAQFFLLVTIPVGLMLGIILPANCELIFTIMALPAHTVVLLNHMQPESKDTILLLFPLWALRSARLEVQIAALMRACPNCGV